MANGIGTNLFVGGTVDIAMCDLTGNAMMVKCTTGNIPSSVAGYAIGCLLINTTSGTLYTNTGTAASCTFTATV